MITNKQIEFYKTNGYVKGIKIIDDHDKVDRLRKAVIDILTGRRDFECNPYNLKRYKFTEGYKKNHTSEEIEYDVNTELGKFDNGWWINKDVRELVFSKKIGEIAAKLMGVDTVRIWHDQILSKPPSDKLENNDKANIGWHQDRGYWTCCSKINMITAWVALQDTDQNNGAMRFVEQSNQWSLVNGGGDFFASDLKNLKDKLIDEGKDWSEISNDLSTGEVSFHHPYTFHGSGPNFSNKPRMSVAIHMMPGDNAYDPNGAFHETAKALGPFATKGQIFKEPFNPIIWSKS
ncbi:phytanoyl-CoA dioxygenase family protein [Pelagibacteraceae bacterium]|nr:phytanoyl-CoA dioxygenase family protein [Pelagibacteraceae bacterium]